MSKRSARWMHRRRIERGLAVRILMFTRIWPLMQEHYEVEKRKADARAEFEAEQAYLKTLSLLRWALTVASAYLWCSWHAAATRMQLEDSVQCSSCMRLACWLHG